MAGIGFTYDDALEVFIGLQPYPSWELDPESFLWEAPKQEMKGQYNWDEEAGDWVRASQPYPSWLWSEESKEWEAPKPLPEDATRLMVWDEEAGDWVEVVDPY